jgi:hypothetical protein
MTLVGKNLVEEELDWFRSHCQKHGKKTELAQFIIDFEKNKKTPLQHLKVRVGSWLLPINHPDHHIPDTNRYMIMQRWKTQEIKRMKNGKRN